MKAPSLVMLVLSMFALSLCGTAQTYFRVNNTGVSGATVFTDLASALVAASSALDPVLIIEGSDDLYDLATPSHTIDFPITIYGTGYFLDENPETQKDTRRTQIDALTFDPGSAGSEIYGVSINTVNIATTNILVSKCNINTKLNITGDDATISKCFIQGSNPDALVDIDGASNAILTNNLFYNEDTGGAPSTRNVRMTNSASALIIYNSFWGDPDNDFINATIQANYFDESEFGSVSNVSVQDNFSTNNFLSAYNASNQYDNLPDSLFCVTDPGASTDGQYQTRTDYVIDMTATNPLLSDPGDPNSETLAGMYAGTDPYLKSGMPRIPSVFEYEGQSNGTVGSGTSSSVKTKTHK